MSGYQLQFRPLVENESRWGQVALIPWDENIFGFPVAELMVPPNFSTRLSESSGLEKALIDFEVETGAKLTSARLPAIRMDAVAGLTNVGFVPVDLALTATAARLRVELLPRPRYGIRRAEASDHEELLRLAGSAFHFGRYHTDPRFPRELANKRYVQWLANALGSQDPNEYVFVLGGEGKRLGFFHASLNEGLADLKLAAIDTERAAGAGLSLYGETLLELAKLGANRYTTKISAANMGIMNLYAAIGFRYSEPEYVLHRHSTA